MVYKYITVFDESAEIRGHERIITIDVNDDTVTIEEGCDDYFNIKLSKKEAIATLNEFISFIENN